MKEKAGNFSSDKNLMKFYSQVVGAYSTYKVVKFTLFEFNISYLHKLF